MAVQMSADKLSGWVAVGGTHPLRGLTLYGPFNTADEASEWANEELGQVGDWWIEELWAAEEKS
jgi:hypothetical protein